MGAHNTVLSSVQERNLKGKALETALNSAFDGENEKAAKEQKKGKKK